GEGELCGRTGNNRVVNFPASDVGLIGRMANVEIVEVLPNSLRGQLL
ncbi:MAG TPA: TRAM domain-containing protein, partial [Pseudomonadales bacterium]|nr:TRAM domain-containing protein [Pseudomonadales bacterium]